MLSQAEKDYIRARPYWTPYKPLALFYRHQVEKTLTRALRRAGVALAGKRLLEDGCGEGYFLRQLVDLEATPRRCVGVDRGLADLHAARERTPASFVAADAAALPFKGATFDVVAQAVLFSSLAAGATRERAAAEIGRVLKPGGVLIWYDFVERAKEGLPRGLTLGDARSLFPAWELKPHKFGLRFRWASFVVNKSRWLADTLAALGVARSHYVIIMRRP